MSMLILSAAPLFQEAGSSVARAQGTIEASDVSGTTAIIDSASYNSGTGYTDYVLTLTGKAILDSSFSPTILSSVISVDSNLEDELIVTGMSHSRLNGTFTIKAITDGTNTITLSVANSNIVADTYNEVNAGGGAQINTNRVVLQAAAVFAADDILAADAILSTDSILVNSVSASSIVITGVTRSILLSAGVRLTGTRTGSEFTLRTGAGVLNVDYLVKGDSLVVGGIDRKLKIIDIDTTNNTITVDESLALN